MSTQVIAIIIMLAMMLMFITQKFSLCTTALLAAFKIISFSDIIKQYGSSLVFCVLGMMIVGGTVFDTGAAKKIGEFLLAKILKTKKYFWLY